MSLLALFAPIQPMLIAALALCIIDMITGIMASIRRKEPITSSRMKRSVSKLVLYQLGLMLSFITQKYMFNDSIPAASLMATMIGAVELKSVLENLNGINGSPLFTDVVTKITQSEQDKLGK